MFFNVKPFVAVNKTQDELTTILAPLVEGFEAAGVEHELVYTEYASYHELYTDLFDDEAAGAFALTGGWLFTHQDVEENNDGIVEALRTAVSPREDLAGQGFLVGHMWDAGHGRPESNSATHPAYRQASDVLITTITVPAGASLEVKADYQDVLTNIMDEALRQAGPNGASYVNEVSLARSLPPLLGWRTAILTSTGGSVPAELAGGLLGR